MLLIACGKLGTDLDDVVALEIVLPEDSIAVGEVLQPIAHALNGRGDTVQADIRWATLDTTILAVDSITGETVGKATGTGRLQARTGALRSNPQNIVVTGP